MSQFLIQDSTLQDIGDAVRSKIDTQTITFPRYVAAFICSGVAVKQSYSYSLSGTVPKCNLASAISTMESENIIDTTKIDHWIIYWDWNGNSSGTGISTYDKAFKLYYKTIDENEQWEPIRLSYADSFQKYTILPNFAEEEKTLYSDQIELDYDTNIIGGSVSISSIKWRIVALPVKEDGSYFIVNSEVTRKWSMPEEYTSASLLPVSKLADILNAIEAPSGGALNFGTNTFYSLTLGRNSGLTVNTAITDLSQIIAFGWWYYDYLYFCYPAREKDSSTGRVPIYRFDPMRDSSRTTYDYLYLSGGKLYTVSNTVASGSNAGGFMIYTT